MGRVGQVVKHNHDDSKQACAKKLVRLRWIAERWNCSRQTCRRVLRAAGVQPYFLGGDARNATLRFDVDDVLRAEREAQGGAGCVADRHAGGGAT